MKKLICFLFGHKLTAFSISVEEMMESSGKIFNSNTCGRCGKVEANCPNNSL